MDNVLIVLNVFGLAIYCFLMFFQFKLMAAAEFFSAQNLIQLLPTFSLVQNQMYATINLNFSPRTITYIFLQMAELLQVSAHDNGHEVMIAQ